MNDFRSELNQIVEEKNRVNSKIEIQSFEDTRRYLCSLLVKCVDSQINSIKGSIRDAVKGNNYEIIGNEKVVHFRKYVDMRTDLNYAYKTTKGLLNREALKHYNAESIFYLFYCYMQTEKYTGLFGDTNSKHYLICKKTPFTDAYFNYFRKKLKEEGISYEFKIVIGDLDYRRFDISNMNYDLSKNGYIIQIINMPGDFPEMKRRIYAKGISNMSQAEVFIEGTFKF